MTTEPFSVLIAVYHGDDPAHVNDALNSVFTQTIVPTEVIVVADGPLPEGLDSVLTRYATSYPETFKTIALESNQGLGVALRTGVKACSHDLVARMDSDDIAVNDRFETQISYLHENPSVDVVGGHVAEFVDDPADPEQIRSVPSKPKDVKSAARFRNPVNHPSVMFRRNAVLEAGNYRPLRKMQDYELWVRMLTQGFTIANIPTVLVKCRAGEELYDRRSGIDYAKLDFQLQREFLKQGAISVPVFIVNTLCRVSLRLIPNQARAALYKTVFRS